MVRGGTVHRAPVATPRQCSAEAKQGNVFIDNATSAQLPSWSKKLEPGAVTLILQGHRHKRDDEDDATQQSTLRLLEVEVSSLGTPPVLGVEGKRVLVLPPLSPKPPNIREALSVRRRGVRPLPGAPLLPPALPAQNAYREALDSLTVLVATVRNDADYASLLVAYYRGTAPAHGNALSAWLTSQPQHPFFWSRLHHRIRWRSPGRGRLSLLDHADAQVPPVRQAGRMLIYV